jgi:hypothetical protein
MRYNNIVKKTYLCVPMYLKNYPRMDPFVRAVFQPPQNGVRDFQCFQSMTI